MESLIKEFEERFDKYCRVYLSRKKDDTEEFAYSVERLQGGYIMGIEGFDMFLPTIEAKTVEELFTIGHNVFDKLLVDLNIKNALKVTTSTSVAEEPVVKSPSPDYDECLSCQ